MDEEYKDIPVCPHCDGVLDVEENERTGYISVDYYCPDCDEYITKPNWEEP